MSTETCFQISQKRRKMDSPTNSPESAEQIFYIGCGICYIRHKADNSNNYVSRFDDIVSVPLGVLKCVGIRLDGISSVLWQRYYCVLYINILIALVLEVMKIVQTGVGASFDDAVEVFRMIPCAGYVLMDLTKSYKIMRHRPVFSNLIRELRSMLPEGPVSEEEHRVMTTALWQLNVVVKGYYLCNMALLLIYMTTPFVALLKRMLNYESPLLLPFVYWFPFDPFQKSVYGIVLIVQTWHGVSTVFFVLCGDLLFCIFLSQITMQFDLLSMRVTRLLLVKPDRQLPRHFPLAQLSLTNERSDSRQPNDELAQIHSRHRDLIRLSADVESMYSFALLVNFLNSSLVICCCGFCSVVVERWNEMAYKFFLATALSQTWLLCWYGQRLLEASRDVWKSLYNCGWYQASRNMRNIILIMMQRAQKEVRVTSYGFSVISLVSYTAIIKTSWSYFMLLIKVYKKK